MLIFIVVIIITGYFYYNYYSSNYDSSHKSWIIASTAVVILHIIYGVSLQTFFYHYLAYCNYCCNRCKKKKQYHPAFKIIENCAEWVEWWFFLFPPNKESKGLPSIHLFISYRCARLFRVVPFSSMHTWKKIRFVGTQLQADMSLHCAQMSRYSRHQIFSILFRFTYI